MLKIKNNMCKKTCRKCGKNVLTRPMPNDARLILKCCNWYKIMTRDEYETFDLTTFDKIRFEPCERYEVEQKIKNNQQGDVILGRGVSLGSMGEGSGFIKVKISGEFLDFLQKEHEKDRVNRTIHALQHGSPMQKHELLAALKAVNQDSIQIILTALEKRELFELCGIVKEYL